MHCSYFNPQADYQPIVVQDPPQAYQNHSKITNEKEKIVRRKCNEINTTNSEYIFSFVFRINLMEISTNTITN